MRWKESSAIIIYVRSTLLYDLQTQNQRTHWNKTVQNQGAREISTGFCGANLPVICRTYLFNIYLKV